MQIAVTIDDLAFVAADAVARPVNAELRAATPVMRRLELAAGEGMLRQLQLRDPLEVGAAVVTGAGAVQADLMIHAVVSTPTQSVTREGVRRATTNALQRAHDFAVDALAIAPFGLGAGNLDVDDAAHTMLAALSSHAERRARPSAVTIVVESDLEADAFLAALARLRGAR
jgi:O-acetyl-ADP-ribose deacetylase (regulator of RNase III)